MKDLEAYGYGEDLANLALKSQKAWHLQFLFRMAGESLGDTFATVKPRHEDVPPSSFGNA